MFLRQVVIIFKCFENSQESQKVSWFATIKFDFTRKFPIEIKVFAKVWQQRGKDENQ